MIRYINDGNGFFSYDFDRLPPARLSSARAQFADVDSAHNHLESGERLEVDDHPRRHRQLPEGVSGPLLLQQHCGPHSRRGCRDGLGLWFGVESCQQVRSSGWCIGDGRAARTLLDNRLGLRAVRRRQRVRVARGDDDCVRIPRSGRRAGARGRPGSRPIQPPPPARCRGRPSGAEGCQCGGCAPSHCPRERGAAAGGRDLCCRR